MVNINSTLESSKCIHIAFGTNDTNIGIAEYDIKLEIKTVKKQKQGLPKNTRFKTMTVKLWNEETKSDADVYDPLHMFDVKLLLVYLEKQKKT